jgi:uncharacterized protein
MDDDRNGPGTGRLRIAAAGDMHCCESRRDEIRRAIEAVNGAGDIVLLAGDLTTHGEPEQAAVLADACAGLDVPALAVLGNHDWHANRRDELVAALESGGIRVLDRSWQVCVAAGLEVGIVGLKGFVGGFPGSHLPDFGEPLLRAVYHETSLDVQALDAGLREIALCPTRIVPAHAPIH